jgi:hypothetical protein
MIHRRQHAIEVRIARTLHQHRAGAIYAVMLVGGPLNLAAECA